MKTKLLIIIGIIIFVVVYLPIHYYYPFLGIGTTTGTFIFCEEGFHADERGKCVQDKQFLDLGKQEPTKLILSIGKPINSLGLIPLTTTLVFTSTQPITTISERSFEPTNYGELQPDEIGTSWDLLPDSLQVRMIIVDETNVDVIDSTVESIFFRNSILYITQATCSDKIVRILYGEAVTVPIKNGTYTVLAKNSVGGLIPNENGEYILDFASFFKQEIELPDGAIVLSSTSDVCSTEIENHPLAYYDRMMFKLVEKN